MNLTVAKKGWRLVDLSVVEMVGLLGGKKVCLEAVM